MAHDWRNVLVYQTVLNESSTVGTDIGKLAVIKFGPLARYILVLAFHDWSYSVPKLVDGFQSLISSFSVLCV